MVLSNIRGFFFAQQRRSFCLYGKVIFLEPYTDLNGLMGEEGDIVSKMVFLKWMGLLHIHRHEVTQCAILLLQLPNNKKLQVLSLELNLSPASPSKQRQI
jgi:hypothetical protein